MTGAETKSQAKTDIRAKRLHLFATPLAACILPQSDQLKAPLKAAVLAAHRAANAPRGPQDPNNEAAGQSWQGAFADIDPADKGLAALVEAARTLVEAMSAAPNQTWGLSWRGEILAPGQGSEVFSLAPAMWCAHYLIDAGGGDGGALELQDPRGAAPVMYAPGLTFAAEGAESLGVSQSIGLKEGALAVFPAWMLQSSRLHQGQSERLSITLRFQPSITE